MDEGYVGTERGEARGRKRLWGAVSLCVLVGLPSFAVLMGMKWAAGTALGTGVFMGSKVLLVVLPVFFHRVVEGRRISVSPVRKGGLGMGVVLGVVIAGMIFAAYWMLGEKLIDAGMVKEMAARTGLNRLGRYVGAAAYWIGVNSVVEEYVYRWFIYKRARRFMGTGAAVLFSAAAFTVHHVIALGLQMGLWATVVGSAGVFIGGLVWSGLYARYESVWPGYVSHAITDVAVFVVGYWLIFG